MVANRTASARNILAMAAALLFFLVASAPAIADEHGEVGHEVKSTNTPGGGEGGVTSSGLDGIRTPWLIAHAAPSTADGAVVNINITYYHCAKCRDEALEKEKAAAEKAKADAKAKAEAKARKKRGEKPPVGPDVITFDPRTHELVDGKVVPKVPKQESLKPDDHTNCDKPAKFECSEHFEWWLKTHKHNSTPSDTKQGSGVADPRILVTGSVVAGEETTVCVRNPNGTFVEGAVVAAADGQRVTTDSHGRAVLRAPKGVETMLLTLVGTQVVAKAFVRESADALGSQISPPSLVQAGQEAPIVWTGANAGTPLSLDGRPLEILASSPTGVIAQVPVDLKTGTHMLLSPGQEGSQPAPLESVSLAISPPKTLVVGQRAQFGVVVTGTQQKLELRLTNHSPQVIHLSGDAADARVFTSGGKGNAGTIPVQSLTPGQILIGVELVSPAPFTDVLEDRLTPEAQIGVDRATEGGNRAAGKAAEASNAQRLGQPGTLTKHIAAVRKWMDARKAWLAGRATEARKAESEAARLDAAAAQGG